jgi:hypothetical protein
MLVGDGLDEGVGVSDVWISVLSLEASGMLEEAEGCGDAVVTSVVGAGVEGEEDAAGALEGALEGVTIDDGSGSEEEGGMRGYDAELAGGKDSDAELSREGTMMVPDGVGTVYSGAVNDDIGGGMIIVSDVGTGGSGAFEVGCGGTTTVSDDGTGYSGGFELGAGGTTIVSDVGTGYSGGAEVSGGGTTTVSEVGGTGYGAGAEVAEGGTTTGSEREGIG